MFWVQWSQRWGSVSVDAFIWHFRRKSALLRFLFNYSWRDVQIFFAFSSIIRDATFRFSSLGLLINYSWRNIQIFFAFSSIIRDATFRFPSPSHQLFVTQQSVFSQLFVTLHSNFSSPHHGQVFMNYILIFLSFSSVIHDSTYVGITHVPATSLKLSCLTCVNCLKAMKLTITFAYMQIKGSVGPTKTVI